MTNENRAVTAVDPAPRHARGASVADWLAGWVRWRAGRGNTSLRRLAAVDLGADASVDAGALLVVAGADPSVRLVAAR